MHKNLSYWNDEPGIDLKVTKICAVHLHSLFHERKMRWVKDLTLDLCKSMENREVLRYVSSKQR